jgi:hypothetical protein
MATLSDDVFDSGLDYITTNVDELHICSAEPTTYAEATSTYSLGSDSVTVGAAADRGAGGREVVVPAISGGSVTATGTASHYALVKTGTSELIATGSLSSTQGVTSGDSFTLTSFAIGIPDPV